MIWFNVVVLKSEFVDRKRNLGKFRFVIAPFGCIAWLHRRVNNCDRWHVEACDNLIYRNFNLNIYSMKASGMVGESSDSFPIVHELEEKLQKKHR